jgi:mono/diheme cytochrome c family protein
MIGRAGKLLARCVASISRGPAAPITGAKGGHGLRFETASADANSGVDPIEMMRMLFDQKSLERSAMTISRNVGAALACAPLLVAAPVHAQDAQQTAQHPGRSVVMSKCFQCHTDAMFRDQRQDRRGWEAAIYRMIGRGGLWTQEEITLMADYLGSDFGPSSKPTSAPSK